MLTALLVEDDDAIREMLRVFLSSKNYRVLEASDGASALASLAERNPEIILLDWMLPDTDGVTLLKKIRSTPNQRDIPVIMLTAKAEERDKIRGLEGGADDYVTKPFSLHEVEARMRSLIRRTHRLDADATLKHGPLELDLENAQLRISGEPVKIGPTELRLLHYFMRTPGRLHTRTQLLDHVWGQGAFIEERTVDVHILRLRKLLKRYEFSNTIETVRGSGYRFNTNTL
ncbi:MAG: response regulator [bacterium]